MRKKDKEFQLLVEGKNDLHVIWNLAERLNLNAVSYTHLRAHET